MSGGARRSAVLNRLIGQLGGTLSALGSRLCNRGLNPEYLRWVRDGGDKKARLDYALDADSVVWDAGGFEGQWTSDILARFLCRVRIFEPMPEAAAALRERFKANPLVRVRELALGAEDAPAGLLVTENASALVPSWSAGRVGCVPVRVRDVAAEFEECGDLTIDLLKLNIEGGEYQVLSRLAERGLLARVRFIQVQFHDFVPDAVKRRERLVLELERTHERQWCYDFVWESWKRREDPAS